MCTSHPVANAGGDRHGTLVAGFRKNEGKLVAPEPSHHISFPRAAADDDRGLRERLAPRQVPVAVVDRFEPVEVQKEH